MYLLFPHPQHTGVFSLLSDPLCHIYQVFTYQRPAADIYRPDGSIFRAEELSESRGRRSGRLLL